MSTVPLPPSPPTTPTTPTTPTHGQQPTQVISAREKRLIDEYKEAREIKTEGLLANWDGNDFRKYKWIMLTVMREHGLDDIALQKLTREELISEEGRHAFDRRQFTIMRLIGTTLPTDKFQQVDHLESGSDMWAQTCEIYEKRSDPTIRESIIVTKTEEMRTLKCVTTEEVETYLTKMFRLRTELASYNYVVNDIIMKEMLLNGLPDLYEFEQLRGVTKYGGNGGQLRPEGLRVLINQAIQRQLKRPRNGGHNTSGNTPGRNGRRGGGNGGGRGQQQQGNGGGGRDQRGNVESGQQNDGQTTEKVCYKCKKSGHLRADCPEKDKGNGSGGRRQHRANFTCNDGKRREEQDSDSGAAVIVEDEPGVATGVAVESTPRAVTDTAEDQGSAVEITAGTSWWCFDTGSNSHIVGDKSLFVHMEDIDPDSVGASVYGVSRKMLAKASGIGTVRIVTQVGDKEVGLFVDDVLYVEKADHGLFSMQQAIEQGFEIDFERETCTFIARMRGQDVIRAVVEQGIWVFNAEGADHASPPGHGGRIIANYTVTDGVATMDDWHKRLLHTNHQYLKLMVDKALVKGMMLSRREQKACDACHVGKQKRKRRQKKLDRGVTGPNQLIYADLLFPPKNNGTDYTAVLVLMDAWSRYVRLRPLKDKSAATVNKHIQQYVIWAERQAGRGIKKIVQREFQMAEGIRFPVLQILTDKGSEFVNKEMAAWYAARGIEHVKVGPKSSHLNACERTHQTLVAMMKASMYSAGFPKSFWIYALLNAVYIKNRIYCKAIEGIPYQRMFGVVPDIHHIRPFGCLVYVQVPVSPEKHKNDPNAVVAFLLGYREDTVGCLVYIPSENTVKFVAEVRVSEEITYGDRHNVDPADRGVGEWLHLSSEPPENVDDATSTITKAPSQDDYMDTVEDDEEDNDGVTASVLFEVNMVVLDPVDEHQADNDAEDENDVEDVRTRSDHEHSTGEEGDDVSVSAHYGSEAESVANDDVIDRSGLSAEGSAEGGDEHRPTKAASTECTDEHAVTPEEDAGESASRDSDSDSSQHLETVVLPPGLRKRVARSETPSELEQNRVGIDTKIRRTGLREWSKIRAPARYDDFVRLANMATRIIGKNGKAINARNLKIPKNRRAALRSKYADFWRHAEWQEMDALIDKGVLVEIDAKMMPQGARTVGTTWVYALKTDAHGYIIRFKARLVALGNWQRPGIDLKETFSPVARMSSFRDLVGILVRRRLRLYGGDINTAYLNATLEIEQYIQSIEGSPCSEPGHVYAVKKALYGLRQSGREWNNEINGWLLERGFARCATEPCLYYLFDGETIVYLLVYVDDVVCATNDEHFKCELFADLDREYGLKDQGPLTEYLGVEIVQNDRGVFICQHKYAREILQKFGYDGANKCGNPMETNARLTPGDMDEAVDTSFDYRGALGMLMYLATSTRPDIAYALGQLSRFVSRPTAKHVGALKRVLRYLAGTSKHGIWYKNEALGHQDDAVDLVGYCDSDWGSDSETRKSTSGFVFTIAGGAVSWMSRRQPIVAQSTAEAEYVAACEASMEAMAQANILSEVMPGSKIRPVINIDNSAALVMATNPTYSRRTRHIELRWHYVRDQVQRGLIELVKVKGEENPADAFTKPLDKARLETLCKMMGVSAME